jgi:exodeoxyribonuclease VII large subunit
LFDPARKRQLPYPPSHIGLIASKESAAYADFNKVLNARWGGVKISHVDVQVQGEQAVTDIVSALELLNQHGVPPEAIVITRGGGSADDLAAFSTEQVTRAVAASRIPTMVAIGHEVDLSLAELAADVRASTPSNAAELLVPDKKALVLQLENTKKELGASLLRLVDRQVEYVKAKKADIKQVIEDTFNSVTENINKNKVLLSVLNPEQALKRGYAVIRSGVNVIRSVKQLSAGQSVHLQLKDGTANATIKEVQ